MLKHVFSTQKNIPARVDARDRALSALFGTFFVTVTAFTGSAQAKCDHTAGLIVAGMTQVDTHWKIERGSPCRQSITGGNGTQGFLDNLVIAERPGHGFAGVNNSMSDHGFAYKPDDSFLESDRFVAGADRHFDWKSETEKIKIVVSVDVVDKF
jgi:hypothetical protein